MKKTAAILFATVALMPSSYAQNWASYPSSAFPAKVRAVVFPSGTLTPTNTMKWGQWTVAFTERTGAFSSIQETPGIPGGPEHFVDIRALQCQNNVIGEVPCRMRLVWTPGGTRLCTLYSEKDVEGLVAGNMIESIICPTSLQLE